MFGSARSDGFGDLGFDGDVFIAEKLDIDAPFFGEHGEAVAGEVISERGFEEFFLKGEENGLDLRLDVLDEVHVGLFDFLVVGVTAFVDVFAAAEFIDGGREFGKIGQPAFQVGRGMELSIQEGEVEGIELGEIGGIEFAWHERPNGGVGSDHQFTSLICVH